MYRNIGISLQTYMNSCPLRHKPSQLSPRRCQYEKNYSFKYYFDLQKASNGSQCWTLH